MGFFTKRSALDSSCCSVRGSEYNLDFETIADTGTYTLRDSNNRELGNVRIMDIFLDGVRMAPGTYSYNPNTSVLTIPIGSPGVAVHVNYELI